MAKRGSGARQAIIPDPVPDGTGQCLWLVCVPDTDAWRRVFRGSVYNLSRGRYWDASTGSVVDAQQIGQEIFESMSCFDSGQISAAIQAGLADVAASLAGLEINIEQNCGDTSVEVSGPGTPTQGEDTTGQDDGSTPPTGFPDYSTYDTKKCEVATAIVDNAIQDFGWVEAYDGVLGSAAAAAITMLPFLATPIPGDELVVALGVFISLLSLDAAIAGTLKGVIENTRNELICALYQSVSPADARAKAKIELDAAVATYGNPAIPNQLEAYFLELYMLGWWGTNPLFEPSNLGTGAASFDCGQCACTQNIVVVFGAPDIDVNANPQTVISVASDEQKYNNQSVVRIDFDCPVELTLIQVPTTGFPSQINWTGGAADSRVTGADGTDIYNGNAPLPTGTFHNVTGFITVTRERNFVLQFSYRNY